MSSKYVSSCSTSLLRVSCAAILLCLLGLHASAQGPGPGSSPWDKGVDSHGGDIVVGPVTWGADPVNKRTGAFSYTIDGLRPSGAFGQLGVQMQYLSSAGGSRSNVSPRWSHSLEEEIVLHVRKRDIAVREYQGPVSEFGSSSAQGGRASQQGTGGGGAASSQGLVRRTEFQWTAYHYHGPRIDEYRNQSSHEDYPYPGSEVFLCSSTETRLLPSVPLNPGGPNVQQLTNTEIPAQLRLRRKEGTILTFARQANLSVDPQFWTFVDGYEEVAYSLISIESVEGKRIDLTYVNGALGGYVVHPPVPGTRRTYRRISTAVSSEGGSLSFSYNANGTLKTVTDHLGRALDLEYNADGNLGAVSTPAIHTNGDNYLQPSGVPLYRPKTVINYVGQTSYIESVVRPNEVRDGSNTPYLKNTWWNARVVQQEVGGTNASGVSAGGKYSFSYVESSPPLQHEDFEESMRTFEIDPSGNVQLTIFDKDGHPRVEWMFEGRVDHPVNPNSWGVTINGLDVDDPTAPTSLSWDYAPIGSEVDGSGALMPTTYVRQYDYDALGNLESMSKDGVTYRYWNVAGNRVITKRTDSAGNESVVQVNLFEPVFGRVWKDVDPRAFGYIPPNGAAPAISQLDRYAQINVYDYQELSEAALQATLDEWSISMQAYLDNQEFVLVGELGVSPGVFAFGIADSDGNRNQKSESAYGKVIRDYSFSNAFVNPLAATPTYSTLLRERLYSYNAKGDLEYEISETGLRTEFEYYPQVGYDWSDPNSGSKSNGGAIAKATAGVGLPTASSSSYEYDALGRLVLLRNAYGAETHYFYDEEDRQVATIAPSGAVERTVFDANGNTVAVTYENNINDWAAWAPSDVPAPLALGRKETYVYDILDNTVENTLEFAEPRGLIRFSTTKFRYDKRGNLVLTLLPTWDAASMPSALVASVYDEWNREFLQLRGGVNQAFVDNIANADIPELTNPQGLNWDMANPDTSTIQEETYYYRGRVAKSVDGEGHEMRYTRDSAGRLKAILEPGASARQINHVYDVAGQVIRKEWSTVGGDILRREDYLRDEEGRVIQIDRHIESSDPSWLVDGLLTPGDGKITNRVQYNAAGLPVHTVDDAGIGPEVEYDEFRRIIRSTDKAGNEQVREYNALGQVAKKTITSTATDPQASQQTATQTEWFYYSEEGWLIASVQEPMGSSGYLEASRTIYDALGNPVFSSDAKAGATGTHAPSSLDRDQLGQHQSVTSPINGHGNQVVYHLDGRGLVLKTQRAMRVGGVGSGALLSGADAYIETARGYDDNGDLLFESDDKGNSTQYEYDGLRRLWKTTNADGGVATLTFDNNSRVYEAEDPSGNKIRNTYDELNRPTKFEVLNFGSGFEGVREELYFYDDYGRMDVAVAFDDTAGLDENGLNFGTYITRQTYTSTDAVVSESLNGIIADTEYDANGRFLRHSYPAIKAFAGSTPVAADIEYSRNDPLKRISGVYLGFVNPVNLAAYEFLGPHRIQSMSYGNQIAIVRQFDSHGFNIGALGTDGGGQVVQDLSYAWNPAGSRSRYINQLAANGERRELEYDSVNQLEHSKRYDGVNTLQDTTSYTLDGVGNRENLVGGLHAGPYAMAAPGDTTNQYSSTPVHTPSYDGNGNLVSAVGASGYASSTYKYDVRNRLVYAKNLDTGEEVRITYDAFGRRVGKRVTGGVNEYVVRYRYLPTGELAHEERMSWAGVHEETVEYIYGGAPGIPMLQVHHTAAGVSENYLLRNDSGSTLAVADASGAVLESMEYDDFGSMVEPSTWLEKSSSAGVRFLFAGQYWDSELDLYFNQARMYDPKTGRFLSRDPLGTWADNVNLGNGYTYAGNDPWTLHDPTGLFSLKSMPHSQALGLIEAASPHPLGNLNVAGDVYYSKANQSGDPDLSAPSQCLIPLPPLNASAEEIEAWLKANARVMQHSWNGHIQEYLLHLGLGDLKTAEHLLQTMPNTRIGSYVPPGQSDVLIEEPYIPEVTQDAAKPSEEVTSTSQEELSKEKSPKEKKKPGFLSKVKDFLVEQIPVYGPIAAGLESIKNGSPIVGGIQILAGLAQVIPSVAVVSKAVGSIGTKLLGWLGSLRSGARSWRQAGISIGDATRIQNAANRTGRTIHVVGSRARGNPGAHSDWDYIIEGANSRTRHSLSSSLPEGTRLGVGAPRNQDFIPFPLDRTQPYVTFTPRRP